MIKTWQNYCNVPLRSYYIELLAEKFMQSYQWRANSATWFDWMTRDFFAFLILQANCLLSSSGAIETFSLGNEWLPRAQTAHRRCANATGDYQKYPHLAVLEWQKVFGAAFSM